MDRAIGRAAIVLMLGNLAGSTLGFVRQAVIAKVFGATLGTDAFFAASIVPQMFYDLTIGAAISAALIPTFSEIIEARGRDDLWSLLGSVLALAWLVLAAVIVLLIIVARPFMTLLLLGYHTHLRAGALSLSIEIVRILIPTLFFLGTSAVLLSALYSLRRFTIPAFAGTLYHLGVILGVVFLAHRLGILALPLGALAGAAGQAIIQVPAILRAGARIKIRLALTPDIRRIIRLYAPVAAGLLVSIAGQIIDLTFKSQLRNGAITDMQFATTLTQFPIGIGVAALTFAVLPSLSSDAAFGRIERFKDTLATGIRLVLFLTIPAAVGYIVLATPIVSLLFQHGHFRPVATARTATALTGYAIQIPFVGIDQLLIFSFYARKNTVTPMLIGILGVGIYIGSALLLMPRYQILGLALANTIQNSLHGLILLGLLFAAIGTFGGRGVLPSVGKSCIAALAMGIAAGLCAYAVSRVANTHLLAGQALDALAPIAVAGVIYVGLSRVMRSAELNAVVSVARTRLGG
ncbi:MAG: murein biosynthesis integral membrane protein MurJ [Chloroflexota bacterium]|nr:murein biosynthesis integral membrane protein MurJ [Chloroflexota bacterium]